MKYVFQEKGYETLSSCYEDNIDKITVGIATVRARLKKGWNLEKALFHPKEKTITTKLVAHSVDGKVYENLSSIADEYGMTLNTIYKRYSRGCRGDDLVPLKKRKSYVDPAREANYKFHAGGVGYKSAADACRKLNIKYVTYRKNLDKGFSVEQALGIEPVRDGRVARGRNFDVDGRKYTINELSKLHNASEVMIRDRLKRGATIRQAIGLDEIPKRTLKKQRKVETKKRKPIRLTVEGKLFTSYSALADAYGLPHYTVRQRIVDYGYTPEDAVKLDGKSKPLTVEGINYPSKAAVAEAYGLTPAVLLGRLIGDVTIEQALGIEIKENSRTITYAGEKYKSLNDLAIKKGISVGALKSRIQSGLSLEEAISAGDRIRNSGRYNLTILQRDSELSAKPAWLYFVRIFINNKERFKIGVTTQTVDKRLKQEAYEFQKIKVVDGTLLDCFVLEQEVIELLYDKRDPEVTTDMVDGYSEIFILNESDIEAITEILDV
ncbi:MAG TPA: GIY-YIG nuclease family protein [Cellvibrionaceae bacterium]